MSEKLKTHKFARKPFYVDAIRVSEENIERVAQWCNGEIQTDEEGKHVKVKVHRPLTDRQTKAYIGDWVLFAGTGFKVYTPKAFDKSFEKVKTLTKEQADEAGITVPHEKRPPKGRPIFADEKGPEGYEPGDLVDVVHDEESKKPVPTAPKIIEDARVRSVSVDKEIGPGGGRIESVEKKDEVDKLFDEVLRSK